MSTLSVITIQNATNIQGPSVSTLPVFQDSNGTEHGRLCRAFANFNGNTSPGTIKASFNVSSITKNGTGDYTINFTNALVDGNYAVTGTSSYQAGVDWAHTFGTYPSDSSGTPGTKTSSQVRVYSFSSYSSAAGLRDVADNSIAIFR